MYILSSKAILVSVLLAALLFVAGKLQAESLTGVGQVRLVLALLDERKQSSYTTTGQLYGDKPGSFILTMFSKHWDDAWVIKGSVSAVSGQEFTVTSYSSTRTGTCSDVNAEELSYGGEDNGVYVLDLMHSEDSLQFIAAEKGNFRRCTMTIPAASPFFNMANLEASVEKIFDKDTGELLLIALTTFSNEGLSYMKWEMLTKAGWWASGECNVSDAC